MHGTHDPPWLIGAYRDQSEIKGTAKFANISECGTMRKVRVLGAPVVFAFRIGWDGTVAGVASEVDGFAGGVFDSPGGPKGGGTVGKRAGGDVLAG